MSKHIVATFYKDEIELAPLADDLVFVDELEGEPQTSRELAQTPSNTDLREVAYKLADRIIEFEFMNPANRNKSMVQLRDEYSQEIYDAITQAQQSLLRELAEQRHYYILDAELYVDERTVVAVPIEVIQKRLEEMK